ncbi:MAG: CoB--CoM heterodisulfide reductase iron-sulfur subunit B family protein [Bacillota bacterium]|nr:CoB--CoM heterodisulfide reductase iron-sulfur subunit B family protein [Bacillota bacterium]
MKLAYYPGCSLHSTAQEYDISLKLCLQSLGIELSEVPDWNCCGATSAHALNEKLGTLLAVRNLSLVKNMSLNKIFAPCAACYNRLVTTQYRLQHEPAPDSEDASLTNSGELQEIKVLSILDLLCDEEVQELIKARFKKSLNGIRVACYYGCFLVRPTVAIGRCSSENPMYLEDILAAAGAEAVSWAYKTECCGAGFVLPEPQVVLNLSREILRDARRSGADVIAVACPLCQMNLDTRQDAIRREWDEDLEMPILYFTQLLGIAMGFSPRALGLKRLMVSPFPVLMQRGIS